ncbi:ABC transporter permease [Kribbia dieselivorans]|uniref:ABC transporter permease n=1 Tax=Kribbia dieselivorans TaxID=331526 RepID=UPI0008398E5E|nr:ABC transporter permease [Kribbia dieselivorans]
MSDLLQRTAQARPNPRQEAAARIRALGAPRSASAPLGLIGVLGLVLIWEFAPRLGLVDAHFVPPLSQILATWWDLATSGELWKHTSASLLRSGAGFALALVTAIPLGAAIAWYPVVHRLLNPVLELFRNTAALALLPVFVLVLGIGETSKVAIVMFACFFPILLSTISGVRSVDPLLLKSARVFGLSPIETFVKVVLPAAVPTIFTGIRIAGSAAILVLIAAEMIGATAGLGFLINYSQFNFLIPQMYAGILTTSLIGLGVNYGLVATEKHLSAWRG